jgi:hypothetical protein
MCDTIGYNYKGEKFIDEEFESYQKYIQIQILCNGIRKSQFGLEQIPVEYLYDEVCICGIRFGHYLRKLPYYLRNHVICMEALNYPKGNFLYIPKNILTQEMCLIYAKVSPFINHIPRKLLNEEMCLYAVYHSVDNLKKIPQHLRTRDVCLMAMKYDRKGAINLINKLNINCKEDREFLNVEFFKMEFGAVKTI